MGSKQVIDECRLCGMIKSLTFEHVPPKAAFNHYPRFYPNTREMIDARYRGAPPPSIVEEPRGAGAYTLCGECNTKRGARYAREFMDWAVSGRQCSIPSRRPMKYPRRPYAVAAGS
jgi:hypothetical protein